MKKLKRFIAPTLIATGIFIGAQNFGQAIVCAAPEQNTIIENANQISPLPTGSLLTLIIKSNKIIELKVPSIKGSMLTKEGVTAECICADGSIRRYTFRNEKVGSIEFKTDAMKSSGFRSLFFEGTEDDMAVFDALEEARAKTMPNRNVLVLPGGYTGLKNISVDNFADGTFRYCDVTSDGLTTIVNKSFVSRKPYNEAADKYLKRLIESSQEDVYVVKSIKYNKVLSERFGCDAYSFILQSGRNEDTKIHYGVAALTGDYVCEYTYAVPLDYSAAMVDFLSGECERLTLVEYGDNG